MAQQTEKTNELALLRRDTVDVAAERIRKLQNDGELRLPADYSAENALKLAWLVLQMTETRDKRPVLEACTRDSIVNSLLDMVVQALTPMKRQCYFIPYGDKLVCQRSYFGTLAVAQRMAGVRDVYPELVYKGDQFEYALDRGQKRIIQHVQRLENVESGEIRAAYAVVEFADGRPDYVDCMTRQEIQRSWAMSRNNPNAEGSTHQKFPGEMSIRTVVNRALKRLINASNDNYLFREALDRAEERTAEVQMEADVEANANGEIIDVEPDEASAPHNDNEPVEDTEPTGEEAPGGSQEPAGGSEEQPAPYQTELGADQDGPGF